jgi:hypothetical protein
MQNYTERDWIMLSSVKWLDTGFGLVNGFIGLLQVVTTRNYSAPDNSRTLQFTIAHTKPSRPYRLPTVSKLLMAATRGHWLPTTRYHWLAHTSDLEHVCRLWIKAPVGCPYIASARTQHRTRPPTILLLVCCVRICYCGHVSCLPWKRVYRAIA